MLPFRGSFGPCLIDSGAGMERFCPAVIPGGGPGLPSGDAVTIPLCRSARTTHNPRVKGQDQRGCGGSCWDLDGANTGSLNLSCYDIHGPSFHTSVFCTSEGISTALSSTSCKSLRTHWVLGVMSLFYFIPSEGGVGVAAGDSHPLSKPCLQWN